MFYINCCFLRFTNYTRRRQLSGSEFPIEENDQFVGDCQLTGSTENLNTASAMNESIKFSLGDDDTKNDKVKDNVEETRQHTSEETGPSQRQKIRNFASQSVTFGDPVVLFDDRDSNSDSPSSTIEDMSPERKSNDLTNNLETTKKTLDDESSNLEDNSGNQPSQSSVLQISIPSNLSTSPTHPTSKGRNRLVFTGQPLVMPAPMVQAPSFSPIALPTSSENIPQAAARDLSSMLNQSMIGEYTSITDAIDTSCIEDCSPPRSPTFSVADSYFGEGEKRQRKKSLADCKDNKQRELKQAEEAEHQRMESLIRHRLRQISQV